MSKLLQQIEFKKYFFIITSTRITRWFGGFIFRGDEAMAVTLYPFIFVRSDTRSNEELIRHEIIHIRQQCELLIIGAILLFSFEYLYARFIKRLDSRQSYYYTALEQEAHRNAMNPDYLKVRKPYAVLKYIKDKKWLARIPEGGFVEKDYS